MLSEFDSQLQKGNNPGAWTCVVMDGVGQLFGTRGLVKIRGTIDGTPFAGALMAATVRQGAGERCSWTASQRPCRRAKTIVSRSR